jgi:hypothetical protein
MPSQVFTTSDAAWPWPAGVTQLTAEAIGGGGASGDASGNPSTGGGGKGGGYARTAITKGVEATLAIVVGAGGVTDTSNGGVSSVTQNGSVVCLATGGGNGAGAATDSTNGAGATTENGTAVGDTTFAGGNGSTGSFDVNGSAGGGSAGPTSAGGNASAATGGTAGTGTFQDGNVYQVAGSNGVNASTVGVAGANYGGAASGGHTSIVSNRAGANGAPGIVVLTWTSTTKKRTIAALLARRALTFR